MKNSPFEPSLKPVKGGSLRGDQLARQWRILRTIESSKQGVTVAKLAEEESCHPRTIWRDLAAIQAAGFAFFPAPVDSHEVKLLNFHGCPPFSPENLCVESFDMLQKRVECVQIDRHVQGSCPVC